jgi:hypothetical protein
MYVCMYVYTHTHTSLSEIKRYTHTLRVLWLVWQLWMKAYFFIVDMHAFVYTHTCICMHMHIHMHMHLHLHIQTHINVRARVFPTCIQHIQRQIELTQASASRHGAHKLTMEQDCHACTVNFWNFSLQTWRRFRDSPVSGSKWMHGALYEDPRSSEYVYVCVTSASGFCGRCTVSISVSPSSKVFLWTCMASAVVVSPSWSSWRNIFSFDVPDCRRFTFVAAHIMVWGCIGLNWRLASLDIPVINLRLVMVRIILSCIKKKMRSGIHASGEQDNVRGMLIQKFDVRQASNNRNATCLHIQLHNFVWILERVRARTCWAKCQQVHRSLPLAGCRQS